MCCWGFVITVFIINNDPFHGSRLGNCVLTFTLYFVKLVLWDCGRKGSNGYCTLCKEVRVKMPRSGVQQTLSPPSTQVPHQVAPRGMTVSRACITWSSWSMEAGCYWKLVKPQKGLCSWNLGCELGLHNESWSFQKYPEISRCWVLARFCGNRSHFLINYFFNPTLRFSSASFTIRETIRGEGCFSYLSGRRTQASEQLWAAPESLPLLCLNLEGINLHGNLPLHQLFLQIEWFQRDLVFCPLPLSSCLS